MNNIPGSNLNVIDSIIDNITNHKNIARREEFNDTCNRLIFSENVCYILDFGQNKFYIGSSLSDLSDRLQRHINKKGEFVISHLIEVNNDSDFTSRVIEKILNYFSSELIESKPQTLEKVNSSAHYNIVFSTPECINIVIQNMLLSPSYDFRGSKKNPKIIFHNKEVRDEVLRRAKTTDFDF